jgi:hypothetical protein
VKSPLSNALSVILPRLDQTWLLRACLYSGESGRRAWGVYCRLVGDLKKALPKNTQGIKTLAPLLLSALQRNDTAVEAAFLTYLKTAYLREQLRSKIYRRILRDTLSALNAEGVSHIVCKGSALADTVYTDPVLRHCHDIDILFLTDNDLSHAVRLFSAMGFISSRETRDHEASPTTFIHESGLPLQLHRRPFCMPQYSLPLEDLWRRSQIQPVVGIPTHILSPADNLLHVCIQAASCSSSRESLRWIPDAWNIMARYPNLDWDVMVECATRSHLALPLSVTLGYLAEELNVSIPPAVLDRLNAAASETDATIGETALSAALAGMRPDLKRLLGIDGDWYAKALLIKRTIFPSPGYLRSAFHIHRSWALPFYYVYRPLRFLARRLRLPWKNRIDHRVKTTS